MIDIKEIYWAAGFLEGEGSFTRRGPYGNYVVAAQVQREPLERLQRIFSGKIFRYDSPAKHPNWSPHYRWYVSNAAARGVMMTVYSLMSPKRRVQIRTVLDAWRSHQRLPKYRTHCPNGHPYAGDNLMINAHTGGRYCRTCANGFRRADFELAQKRLAEDSKEVVH